MYYIASTTLGMTWSVSVSSLKDRPTTAYGIEGKREGNSFTTVHPGSRYTPRVPVPKPATVKRKREALIAVLDHMRINGLITEDGFNNAHTAALTETFK